MREAYQEKKKKKNKEKEKERKKKYNKNVGNHEDHCDPKVYQKERVVGSVRQE